MSHIGAKLYLPTQLEENWPTMLAKKRAVDLLLGIPILIFLLPLILLIAMLIKLTSHGPIFFTQDRVGFRNQLFKVYKFRTMYVTMLDSNATVQTSKNDRRVTKLGAFLRKTSLDELPQLFNVVLGDMSIVGPRPHALGTKAAGLPLQEAVINYNDRHQTLPGITGWAQVNGYRGELDTVDKLVKRVEYDIEYIGNWSVKLDLLIILKTVLLVLHDPHAY